jgi:preprotein translocase subunit YajC
MSSLFLQAAGGSSIVNIVFMVAIFAVFYFFIIRPQNQIREKQKNFVANLKKGDKVVTTGGIHGIILEIEDNTVILSIDQSNKTRVTLQREAISMDYTASLK